MLLCVQEGYVVTGGGMVSQERCCKPLVFHDGRLVVANTLGGNDALIVHRGYFLQVTARDSLESLYMRHQ